MRQVRRIFASHKRNNICLRTGPPVVVKRVLPPSRRSAVLYVTALRQMYMSIAFPTVSLGYLLITAIDYFCFKEPVGLAQLGGLVLIVAGVALLHQ